MCSYLYLFTGRLNLFLFKPPIDDYLRDFQWFPITIDATIEKSANILFHLYGNNSSVQVTRIEILIGSSDRQALYRGKIPRRINFML